jgi:hypothetical protein
MACRRHHASTDRLLALAALLFGMAFGMLMSAFLVGPLRPSAPTAKPGLVSTMTPVAIVTPAPTESPGPTPTPKPRSQAPLGQWRVLILAYSEMRVTWPKSSCGPAGGWLATERSPSHDGPSDAYIAAVAAARRLPAVVNEWSAGRVAVEATFVEVDHPITKISITDDCEIWPTSKDLSADIAQYVPAGRYDGIFVIWPDVTAAFHSSAWGLTIAPTEDANGAAYTTVSEGDPTLWSDSAEPAEVFVHEMLHQIIETARGRGVPDLADLHQPSARGYSRDANGSYRAWYSDYLTGEIRGGGGLTARVWTTVRRSPFASGDSRPTAEPVSPSPESRLTPTPSPKAVGQSSVVSSGTAKPTPSPTPVYRGRNRIWIPSLELSQQIYSWGCKGGVLANRVYRWTCSGKNNLDLLGHAWGVFAPMHDYYVRHHRMPANAFLMYADGSGKVRRYDLAWTRVVNEVSLQGGKDRGIIYDDLARPSITLETCIGKNNIKRLVTRWVLSH